MSAFEPSSCIDPTTNQLQWNTSFIGIPRPLLRHPSFASLRGNAVKLLLAMDSGYVGNNNGELIATFPVMKAYGFNSKDAIAKALCELLQAGMIIRTRRSDYKRAATYAVTWRPVNKPGTRGPYDAGIAPADVAEDRWRNATPQSTPAASAPTATAVAVSAPSSSAASAPASAPVATPAATTPGRTSTPVTAVTSPAAPSALAPLPAVLSVTAPDDSAPTSYSSPSAVEQEQPPSGPTPQDLSSPRARWPEIKARWNARLAAEARHQAERAAARDTSRSEITDEEVDRLLAELAAW